MRASRLAAAALFATLAVQAPSVLAAPKTDVLIFSNGDRLTGEIKSLQRGQLHFNTDATGTIEIEWHRVARLSSGQHIQVETSSGRRYFGSLPEAGQDGRIIVDTENGPQVLETHRVITMEPIEGTGLSALDVDVSVGYNFAKANGIKQMTIGTNADYRTLLRIYSLKASTTTSDSGSQQASRRANLGLQYTRLWQNRWTTLGSLSLDQNDELGLNLRTSLGFGFGRFLVQNNSMLFNVQAVLQASRENLVAEAADNDSLELRLSGTWDWFRFDSPELDWSNTLQIIPSLTDKGRVRGEFDTSLKWEMINDLNWALTFYSSYDNKPQSGAANATIDYGVNTNLVYEF